MFSGSYELLMGLRYLRSKKRRKIIPMITVISIMGIAIGVMTLIVVISVMTGFDRDLKKRILGVYAPVTVTARGILNDYEAVIKKINTEEHVRATSPFVTGQIMANVRDRAAGVIMRGIDPGREKDVSNIMDYLKKGTIDFDSTGDAEGIVVGIEFMKHYKVKIGDDIDMVSPVAIPTPVGLSSNMIKYRIIGIFDTGMYEYDLNLVYVSLRSAQRLFGLGKGVTGITIQIDKLRNASLVKEALKNRIGRTFVIRTWIDLNRNLFRALLTEKWVMFWILSLIVLVAAFNIASTLIMVVMEKTKDIGILKSLGATKTGIMKIFVYQGVIVGVIGTVIGFVSGLLLAAHINPACNFIARWTGFEFFPKDVYYLDKIPAEINLSDAMVIAVAAVLISVIASLYPAWQASKLDPVEAIRYE